MIWLAGGQVNACARYTATVQGKTFVCTVGEQVVRHLGQAYARGQDPAPTRPGRGQPPRDAVPAGGAGMRD